MKVNVGSTNPNKVEAVREVIKKYDIFSGAEVFGLKVSSGVPNQPKSIDGTIRGAFNRAENSFQDCDYSFGIESGLMEVPYTKSGYMNICACSIYDGKSHSPGISSGFEYPRFVIEDVLNKGLDVEESLFNRGLTNHKRIGAIKGILDVFTKGRIDRKQYTQQAIQMALIQLENWNLDI